MYTSQRTRMPMPTHAPCSNILMADTSPFSLRICGIFSRGLFSSSAARSASMAANRRASARARFEPTFCSTTKDPGDEDGVLLLMLLPPPVFPASCPREGRSSFTLASSNLNAFSRSRSRLRSRSSVDLELAMPGIEPFMASITLGLDMSTETSDRSDAMATSGASIAAGVALEGASACCSVLNSSTCSSSPRSNPGRSPSSFTMGTDGDGFEPTEGAAPSLRFLLLFFLPSAAMYRLVVLLSVPMDDACENGKDLAIDCSAANRSAAGNIINASLGEAQNAAARTTSRAVTDVA
mmetsp:Transcript_12887/g.36764  ORF Transcript_12887/g.36764 Transcript_12887/m.36764 type:complete len:295 (+) Transcript_12887:253-1137(+)